MLIISKVVVKFSYWVVLRDGEYLARNYMHVISIINSKYPSNIQANKQLVNSENWTLN